MGNFWGQFLTSTSLRDESVYAGSRFRIACAVVEVSAVRLSAVPGLAVPLMVGPICSANS
jgi:hypothetical protein